MDKPVAGKLAAGKTTSGLASSSLVASFTPRCREVLAGLEAGLSNREIAVRMHIKPRTVKSYLHKMFREAQITGGIKRVRLVAIASGRVDGLLRDGLNEPTEPVEPTEVPDLSWTEDDPAALYARRLTRQEIAVAGLLTEGYPVRTIASRRHIRQGNVRLLVHSLLRKLDLPNRYALIRAWQCPLFHEGLRALQLLPPVVRPAWIPPRGKRK